MPSMYEIYDAHSDRYHELVMREDYQGNLARALKRVARWRDAVVVEAGIGTGRVTRIGLPHVFRKDLGDSGHPPRRPLRSREPVKNQILGEALLVGHRDPGPVPLLLGLARARSKANHHPIRFEVVV